MENKKVTNKNQYRARLLKELEQYSLSTLEREALLIEKQADEMDVIQSTENRNLAVDQLQRNAARRLEIRAALARLEDDAYGICVDCDDDIAPKRLQAVPWASRCVSCQEKWELENREEQSQFGRTAPDGPAHENETSEALAA